MSVISQRKRLSKRSQAAMEFLMTYGWAILVVLAAIGALAYFGVTKPQQFIPDVCTFPSGFHCVDFVVDTNSADMVITNSLGKDATLTGLTLGDCAANSTLPYFFENGEQITIRFTDCDNGAKGSKFNSDISLNYYTNSLNKTHTGEITTTVQ
ncbi:hypothetical protein HN419_01265 [Candidatus Woesearchaeota archaeon]|jgi:hypothetical protein|nr:hypothetical protein [Candidatus Woesearchaeota archaeon]MBT3537374.1 hypothetical protein [Candidatus Woesearchaeota archaeon]MBT4697101.1 hypothetical protein [Candidatus Woesearchaeota archaeon]MBT4717580.1 hypothetical protein [Candidatus Woesearchaeota archaeon]MBT7106316.1 hypothetical protein [Candidatus Woesearchaeota archaeon]